MENDEELDFISNNSDISALQIEKGRELYMDHFTRNGESESDNRYAVGQINGLTMAEIIE